MRIPQPGDRVRNVSRDVFHGRIGTVSRLGHRGLGWWVKYDSVPNERYSAEVEYYAPMGIEMVSAETMADIRARYKKDLGIMDNQQAKDLQEFKDARSRIQDVAFDSMRDILRESDEDFKHRGYKTREEAVVGAYKRAAKRIEELMKYFLKKYPD